jgi:hypothetical protein
MPRLLFSSFICATLLVVTISAAPVLQGQEGITLHALVNDIYKEAKARICVYTICATFPAEHEGRVIRDEILFGVKPGIGALETLTRASKEGTKIVLEIAEGKITAIDPRLPPYLVGEYSAKQLTKMVNIYPCVLNGNETLDLITKVADVHFMSLSGNFIERMDATKLDFSERTEVTAYELLIKILTAASPDRWDMRFLVNKQKVWVITVSIW